MESVCIFGSSARGKADALSDKDVLVVSDSYERRTALRSEWAQKGWSVASYLPARLGAISAEGGLFVQHLKQEGLIVSDPQGWLSCLLNAYQPKESYFSDFIRSIKLLRPLDRQLSRRWELLFAADVLYVFVRNAGIYELASRKIYEFSYERIISCLSERRCISKESVDALLRLRILKSSYRERTENCESSDELYVAIEAVRSMFGISIDPVLPVNYRVRFCDNRYSVLRDLEARLVGTFDIRKLDSFAVDGKIDAYWRMINDPRAYSWSIRRIGMSELDEVNRLIDAAREDSVQCSTRAGAIGQCA